MKLYQPKEHLAQFRFFGKSNDLLPVKRKNIWFFHSFNGQPSIKDSIESLGVPHTEIDFILVNGKSVTFAYQLKPDDKVAIYSGPFKKNNRGMRYLNKREFSKPQFVLDAHLGKLTRYLRLLGFHVLYQRNYPDQAIVKDARMYERIVLTRDVGLLKNKIIQHGYWVRETNPIKQIKEIVKKFCLSKRIKPFRICLECNGKIKKVAKTKILNRLLPETQKYYRQFYMCQQCMRIYWQGTHFKKLTTLIKKIQQVK